MYEINIDKSKCLQHGIDVNKIKIGVFIFVRTRNSLYKITKKQKSVLFQGGKFFQTPKEVTFIGSSIGSMLKIGWIGHGMRMEVFDGRQKFSTSIVQSARIVGDGWEYDMEWGNGKISTVPKALTSIE